MTASRKKFLFATCAAAFAAVAALSAPGAKAQDFYNAPATGGMKAGEIDGIANLPVCRDVDGREVAIRIEKTHPHALLLGKAWNHPYKGPMINFEIRQINNEFSLPLQRFLAEHECAHHALGHIKKLIVAVSQGQQMPPDSRHSFEMEADTYAVQNLFLKYGYGRKEIEQIFSEIGRFEHEAVGDSVDRSSHPRPRQRLENALAILDRAYTDQKNTAQLRR